VNPEPSYEPCIVALSKPNCVNCLKAMDDRGFCVSLGNEGNLCSACSKEAAPALFTMLEAFYVVGFAELTVGDPLEDIINSLAGEALQHNSFDVLPVEFTNEN
jgi:hypothetical protein